MLNTHTVTLPVLLITFTGAIIWNIGCIALTWVSVRIHKSKQKEKNPSACPIVWFNTLYLFVCVYISTILLIDTD